MSRISSLKVSSLKYAYNNNNLILNGIDLNIFEGEILSILGPSGCGKTTLLRLISGLERLYQGQIKIYKKTVSSSKVYIPPNKRGLGLVLQEKVLFPHLSILNNVKFGIRGDNDSRKNKALEFLKLFKVDQYANSYPNNLSGGEQQRVAIARSISPNPKILLMDEPFGSLDDDLKKELREETKKIIKKNKTTCILVTHNIEDALSMSDRIIRLKNGKIEEEKRYQLLFIKNFNFLCNNCLRHSC